MSSAGVSWRFRPGLVPTLATALLLPVLVSLGVWQLQRAQYKAALQTQYDTRSQAQVMAIGGALETAEALRYRRIWVKGQYEPAYQILVDNRVVQGRAGYYVITPLRIHQSDTRILINRGWVPVGADRQVLPEIDAPTGNVEITGIAIVPGNRFFTLADPGPVTGPWQKLWQNLDMARYQAAVQFSIQPVVVLLDPNSLAGGYTRRWARMDTGIATHRSYAFQWFSLAIALLAIYILVNIKRLPDTINSQDEELR